MASRYRNRKSTLQSVMPPSYPIYSITRGYIRGSEARLHYGKGISLLGEEGGDVFRSSGGSMSGLVHLVRITNPFLDFTSRKDLSPVIYLGQRLGGWLCLESSSRYPRNRKLGSKFSAVFRCT
jgi:hypothetical protein